MIALAELNPNKYPCDPEQVTNLNILLERMNKVRTAYAKAMTVNSGLRSNADQLRINPSAPRSNHLAGSACDIKDDANGTLWFWCMANLQLLKDTGLWLEHGNYTHGSKGNWVHFQIVPPKSGKRIFIPSSEPDPNPTFWDGKYDPIFDKLAA